MSSWDKVNSFRKELTEKIVEQLEQGNIPWERPWVTPYNPVSETVYKGINRLNLGMTSANKDYNDPRWCTFHQAQQNGWKIKQGEKASQIEFWQWTEKKPAVDENGQPKLDTNGKQIMETIKLDKGRCVIYSVFNASQIEGMPPLEQKQAVNTIETAEKILTNSGAVIEHNSGSKAYYSPLEDKIVLPEKNFFKSTEGYYGTALHELAHWTGHESRLNRNLADLNHESYAKEELRAELASSFVNHELGTTRDVTDTAAYVQSWIKALQNDKNEIFKAAYEADKISDFIMEFGREKTLNRETEAVPERLLIAEKNARTDIIINVPREIKDDAKALGAKWNPTDKTWYIPKGENIASFVSYLPEDGKLAAMKDTPLFVPYDERETVKSVAKWDNGNKAWYLPAGEDTRKIPEKYFEFQRQQETPKKTFEEFAAERGLIIEGQAIADGLIHRVPVVDGKPKTKDGAYVLHDDSHGRAGYVENFRTGEKATFGERNTEIVNNVNKDQLEKISAERQAERQKTQNESAKKADYLVKKFDFATKDHPYLKSKGVMPDNAKVDSEGTLIIPMTNINGEIRSFQRISDDGRKNYITGGQKSGCFYDFGDIKSAKQVIICEGFSTGASIFEATKIPTVSAMDASNLKQAATEIRQAYGSEVKIIIAGDNDHKTPSNPGKYYAEEAAKAVGGNAIVPELTPEEKAKGFTDFNDLHQSRGKGAVKEQLEKALSLEKAVNRERDMER